MELYYKLGLASVGIFVFLSVYMQMDLDFDLMKEQIGFSENIIKRKFKWYVLNLFIATMSFAVPWFI